MVVDGASRQRQRKCSLPLPAFGFRLLMIAIVVDTIRAVMLLAQGARSK